MSDNNEDHYQGALLEDINDKLRGIAEAVGGLSDKVENVDRRLEQVEQSTKFMDGRLGRVEQNTELLPVINDAVTAMSSDIDDHEARLRTLERRAA
jgi:uncharacterized coiled-coil protein SlyX